MRESTSTGCTTSSVPKPSAGDGLQEVSKQGCSCACPPEGSANDGKDRGVCEPGSVTGGLFGDAVPHDCPPGDGERGGECEQHSNKIALHFLNRS